MSRVRIRDAADRAARMMYSPGPMDGGEIDVRRLEERLSELEKLAEELESVPDSGVADILDRAVALLAEVNSRVEAGLASTEGEVRAALSGNLCRCTGYQAIVDAVLAVAAERGEQ